MKKRIMNKKFIVKCLLLILIVSNFSITFAYWASNIAGEQTSSDSVLQIGQWDFVDPETTLAVLNFRNDHAVVLALSTETVQLSDKPAVEAALAAYGLLTEDAKEELTAEKDLLLSLLTEIIAFEHSEFLNFEGYVYDTGLTGTVEMNARTWYGNAVYISNDPAYDVWNDTRSLALKTGAYFESRDLFINGIDRITLYHGALNFDNGNTFAFKVQYALESNPSVWLTVQEGGADLIIDVISGTPLTYSEINVNITEAINIRFTPVIGNTTDYINLDDIRIYEHVVSSALEIETYRTIYASVLELTLGTVDLGDQNAVTSALASYDLLSVEAKAGLTVEKALLDSLLIEIELQEALLSATNSVILAESTNEQTALNAAQILVSALPDGLEKTALQNRIDAVQDIIDSVETFLFNYADVLSLTTLTVEVTDKPDVENALDAYYILSTVIQAELTSEKALLDSLLIEINSQTPTEALVLEFRTNHATALALTLGTVQVSDQFILEQALAAYELLTPEAKTELTLEKALLDSLLDEIMIQEATIYVVIAETSSLQADLNTAQAFVSALPNSTEKDALQSRLDAVQLFINTQAADDVDSLIVALPSSGAIELNDETSIIAARAAYDVLTPTQKVLVVNEALLISAENELLDLQAATDQVILAETSKTQIDHDLAQVLVTALVDGAPKTALQVRLDAVQDFIDVEQAKTIITNYFSSNLVVVTSLTNNTIKQTAFLSKANEITSGLGVTITVTNSVRVSKTISTYTISIVKNGTLATLVVSVTFVR